MRNITNNILICNSCGYHNLNYNSFCTRCTKALDTVNNNYQVISLVELGKLNEYLLYYNTEKPIFTQCEKELHRHISTTFTVYDKPERNIYNFISKQVGIRFNFNEYSIYTNSYDIINLKHYDTYITFNIILKSISYTALSTDNSLLKINMTK